MEASSPTDAKVTIDNRPRVAMSATVYLKRNQNFSFLFGSNSACLDRCEYPSLTSGGVSALSTCIQSGAATGPGRCAESR